MSDKNIVFLFGAGAETNIKDGLHFPSGAQYTKETILTKKSNMMKMLEVFYGENIVHDFAEKYRKDFLFRKDSNTFRTIIKEAIEDFKKSIGENDKENKKTILYSKKDSNEDEKKKYVCEIKLENNDNSFTDEFKKFVEMIYDFVVVDEKDCGKESTERTYDYKFLEDYFKYYGSIEKDFSTIIKPKEAGCGRFWRLINYFWSAYFSIMLPLTDYIYLENEEYRNNKYGYILNNLNEIIRKIYSENWNEILPDDHYYKKLHNEFAKNSFALTTNYTPFIESIWGKENCSYLAGSLKLMEDPVNLEIIDYSQDNVYDEKRFIFPFMMTQAPVKPIVAPCQIEEYYQAIDALTHADLLVLVGYGLNKSDNHITALIRNYIMSDKNKKLIYLNYIGKKAPKMSTQIIKETVQNNLHLNEEVFKNQIFVKDFNESDKIDSFCDYIKKQEEF